MAQQPTGDPRQPTGVRLDWSAVPARVRELVAARLGAPVRATVTQRGGFSPGVAVRAVLADGRRVFIKAAGPRPNPHTRELHRTEAAVVRALPAAVPAPQLLSLIESAGWVVLVFQDVAGLMPRQPWRPADLRRVLAACAELAATLDPSPVPAPTVVERFDDRFHGWRTLLTARQDGREDAGWLDDWARRRLPDLAALEADWAAAAAGRALCHGDLRADNVLLTETGVVLVDWPHAALGPSWFDVVGLGPSVLMWDGSMVGALDEHLLGRDADRERVTAVLAALAGFFLSQSREPAPPGLPTLRPFQRVQGVAALGWLRARTGWA
jgi:aminoglycoside phosphotransferase (APT) family kinase protein